MTVCVTHRAIEPKFRLYNILPVGVEISIREPEYSVGESESVVTVCAGIISGEAAIPLQAVLMTVSDGNAEGKCSMVCTKSSTRVYLYV